MHLFDREKGSAKMGNLVPFVGMVMVILAQVSSMVITKAAMSSGVDKYVLIVYSNALSSLILLPCSFVFHRSVHLPWNSSNLCILIFLLSLIGCIGQLCGYAGIEYSSPAMATAMLNLVPAFTFILAIVCRMEKHKWRSTSSQAKVLGTTISIAGAFVVTFYKGPTILRLPHQLLSSPQINWILGGLLLAVEAFINSAWYVIQDLSAWKLKPNIGLVAILYSAIVATTFRISLCSWCLWKVGPLYVSMFKPLATIFAAVMGIVFLGDDLSLGRVIGAIIIVSGFYGVLWGKAKEESGEESLRSPLLQNRTEDKRSFA
ncbi:WAT1-related protein At5g40240-like isoform X2 [Gossypium arboreum]|uniref:WAT1-related protein At5g40240-like isoform X2 n=1 Tax=Gossypium arboreum TaxID=29729 RepID=UPI0022F1997E|nr:WAT1-related protein At5g40240-like isoform X2 [Gossypium arboreum]